MNRVVAELEAAVVLFKERNLDYGNSFVTHGDILKALFPDGLHLMSADDFTRFGVFNAIVGKMNRQAANFDKGGHLDSMRDIIAFAAMQIEVDYDDN